MHGRVCICCGEPMPEHPNAFTGNPNICACCSSLVDGMKDTDAKLAPASTPGKLPAPPPEDERLAA